MGRYRCGPRCTGDQFYDEAQWESYRRLGAHALHAVLRPLGSSTSKGHPVDQVFMEASQRWHPQLDGQSEIFLQLTERCAQIESDIRQNAPPSLRAEFFPEVGAALRGTPGASASAVAPTEDDVSKTLYFLLLVLQVMEDAWLAAQLETMWSHPLNEGWMNYFQRWASTPSLRRWWPILRPIHGPGFRDFVRDRFDLRLNEAARDEHGPGPQLALIPVDLKPASSGPPGPPAELAGLAWERWCQRYREPCTSGKQALVYQLTLDPDGARVLAPIQVGFLLYSRSTTGIDWLASDLFVPHSLLGAGIVARFLDAAIRHFTVAADNKELHISVALDEEAGKQTSLPPGAPQHVTRQAPPRRDAASRRARVQNINFYKSRGFVYSQQATDDGAPRILTLHVPASPPKES